MNDYAGPGYLARLASRATRPATGLRPRTAGMFEGASHASADTFGDAVGRWTPAQQAAHTVASDADGREPGHRPSVEPQVEATPTAAGADISADSSAELTTKARDGATDGSTDGAWTSAVPPERRRLWAASTSVADAHDTGVAAHDVTEAHQATLPIPNGKNVFQQISTQTMSGGAGGSAPLEVASHDARPGSADRVPDRSDPGLGSPSPSSSPPDLPSWEISEPALPSPRPIGEPARRQAPLPAPDPPGLPRLHPSMPEPDATPAGVTVTIGRIEVLPPAPDKPPRKPPRQRARPATAPLLGDYLRQRRDGR